MNKGFLAFGLFVLCIILTARFFPFAQSPMAEDTTIALIEPETITETVPVDKITTLDDKLTYSLQTIEESELIPPNKISAPIITEPESTVCEVSVVIINDKPEPSKTFVIDCPYITPNCTPPKDLAAYQALDPIFTNPNVKPDGTPVTAAPQPHAIPIAQELKSGATNDKGEIWIPGFGWVFNHGGGGHGTISIVDGCIDTIIGY